MTPGIPLCALIATTANFGIVSPRSLMMFPAQKVYDEKDRKPSDQCHPSQGCSIDSVIPQKCDNTEHDRKTADNHSGDLKEFSIKQIFDFFENRFLRVVHLVR
jgi:hypothetical protein